VFGALGLALISDSVAFLSNVTAGIPSVIQFGIGATVALVAAFVVLGVLVPLLISRIDALHDAHPGSTPGSIVRIGGVVLASMFAGAAVLVTVVFPPIGIGVVAAFLLLFIGLPLFLVGRSPQQALESRSDGLATDAGSIGGGPMLGLTADVVAAICRVRVVFLPVVFGLSIVAAVFAVRVEAAFDVKDFFSSDADFVVGLDKLDEHVGELRGEEGVFYIEADLTDPAVLAAIEDQFAALDAAASPRFARDDDGGLLVSVTPSELSADALGSPAAVAQIEAASGVGLADQDGDGIVDTSEQLAALFATGSTEGIALDEERLRHTGDQVRQVIWHDGVGAPAASRIAIELPGTRAVENIAAAQDELTPFLESFNAALVAVDPDARVALTGGPFTRQEGLDATYRALQFSLPVAVVLCFVAVALFMRSIRYAFASIVPILLVVVWLYAFMYVAGFTLNLVTATIGAISVGVGIDYAIHYTMRFREEVERYDRMRAVQRVGASTGNALIGSAVSSVIGFAVMSFAPMPLFATYGFLTAVMIILAAAAALIVLPPLLMVITPERTDVEGGA
jgi:predicted RND superfamily exporter protein